MTGAIITCLGKLPIHGDFVRCNHAQASEIVEVDRWLLEGMERAYGSYGRAFDAQLRALPPLRFLYQSASTGRLLDGLVLPSADQVGRAYPFVAGFVMPAPSPGPAYDRLPLVGQPHLDAIVDLFANAQGQSLPQFLDRFSAIGFLADESAAEQTLRRYLLGTTLEAIWADWPAFHSPERRLQCLQEIWHMGQPPFPPRYMALIPNHGQPSEAAFWLTLLRQWSTVRQNPTLLCWPVGAGTTGPVRLLYDELRPRYFEAVFWPAKTSNMILDLGRQQAQHRSPGTTAVDLSALLRPRALLQDVILAAGRL